MFPPQQSMRASLRQEESGESSSDSQHMEKKFLNLDFFHEDQKKRPEKSDGWKQRGSPSQAENGRLVPLFLVALESQLQATGSSDNPTSV